MNGGYAAIAVVPQLNLADGLVPTFNSAKVLLH